MNSDFQRWGIAVEYEDPLGTIRRPPRSTLDSILATMSADGTGPEGSEADPLVVDAGTSVETPGEWHLALEEGEVRSGVGALPHDLPLGYHALTTVSATRTLVVAPSSAPDFVGVRQWGWATQLYALRSQRSWGHGDLGDLARFGRIAKAGGADFVLLNPLHASIPGIPQQASPYYPSSREFRNPLYIDIGRVPGCEIVDDHSVAAARAANAHRQIDRDAVFRSKMDALARIWSGRSSDYPGFSAYCELQGEGLLRYATYCVLCEQHGMSWRDWPKDLRHPSSNEVVRFAQDRRDRVLFHQWLQWLLDSQLAEAAIEIDFVNDLAIGVDPAGADAWLWQDAFALNMRVGAPPDEFNQRGQDWGLPPFDPWKLRRSNYEPFIRTIRANLAHSGGIRIDHVMGLFRLYWIPDGASARDGTYVQYPYADLLRILCLEAARADALVVGEDLGTVEKYMRRELSQRNIASYRLLWFEDDRPEEYPQKSMAAVTTHDLPTVAGLWSGSDLRQQHDLGQDPNVEATEAIKRRVAAMGRIAADATPDVAADGCHRLLAGASSAMVGATLEDALRLEHRPNYPGTTDEWPNWSVALPVDLEHLADQPGFRSTQAAMNGRSGDNGVS